MKAINIFLSFYFVFLSLCSKAQFKSLAICKDNKTKMIYKQGQVITLSTKQNDTISGVIYLIDEEAIYLNQDKEVALKDIRVVHPIFKPKFSFYKPETVREWVNMAVLSLATLALGSPDALYQLWMPNAQQQANLTNKQRRLNKKEWRIGSKYHFCLK